ncbi:MAG: serine/threonine-protein kinase [Acidobacteriota bacterium]
MTEPFDRERWARVTRLFGDALDRPTTDREPFVRREAGADAALADEVLSLLGNHSKAGDFLERLPDDAAGAAEAAILAPNALVGHYRILGLLGMGGMGVVYLADDTRLGRKVALKAVAPALADDPVRAARLRREARAAAALNHPGIATVHALEEIGGRLYIVSEFVPGETLRDELSRGPLSPRRVREAGIDLAGALASAHERGVIHRDLKPENIVRGRDGRLKILDFGLAQIASDVADGPSLTRDGGILGTPAYMSPEQIRGDALDGRSDLFALGVLLYELRTGAQPFAADTQAGTLARILQDDPAPISSDVPAGSPPDDLPLIIARLLEKIPGRRFASADTVVAVLEGRPLSNLNADAQSTAGAPLWWWQFHQAAATVAYALLMIPLWRLRHLTDGVSGMALFLVALVAVVVSGALRLHGWFGARQYHDAWRTQRARGRVVVVTADLIFAATLLGAGVRTLGVDDRPASLLVAAAASVVVSLIVVEPATTRAAFGDAQETGNRES